MPIFKRDADDRFVPFEPTPFPDLEKTLENWIEKNPHLLLEGEELAIIGRQPRTKFDKYLDLLAVDETGACVVVELKKGETPRDVIAQALEYAAWVDSLSPHQLNDLAHDYAESRKLEAVGVEDLYRMTFDSSTEDGAEEEDREAGATRVTFNSRQRIVIVAERISDEVEQTLRYLRTRFGADVYGITFSVHRLGGDEIISTTTVVGRESVTGGGGGIRGERESNDDIRAKVRTDFLRWAVTGVEEWATSVGLVVREQRTGSDHSLYCGGIRSARYYYTPNWLFVRLYDVRDNEVQTLLDRLSDKSSVLQPRPDRCRFHVLNESDFKVFQDVMIGRIGASKTAEASP